jgi:long-subunit fatty acid transport protein
MAALLTLWPAAVLASGFEVPDNGTQALGRGTAFTAVANDGTAIEYNPAGLAQMSGLTLTLDLNQLTHNVSYTRTDPDGTDGHTHLVPVKNINPPFMAPMAALTYARDLPLGRAAITAGAYGPPSVGKYMFPNPSDTNNPAVNAPQRYQLIQNNIFIVYPTLAATYQVSIPFGFISAGVAGQAVYSTFQFDEDLYAQPSQKTAFGTDVANGGDQGLPESQTVPAGTPNSRCDPTSGVCTRSYSPHPPTSLIWEDPGWDAEAKVNMKGKVAYTAVLGALVKLGPLKVGASYRPGYKLHATGTIDVTLPSVLTDPNAGVPIDAQVKGNQATLDLSWPSMTRIGADVSVPFVPGDLDVSFDYTYTTWGVVDEFLLTPTNVQLVTQSAGTQSLAPVHIPKHLKNASSYRFGVGYELPIPLLKVQARAGGYYDQSALPEQYTTIDLAHFDEVGLTAGASVGINIGDIVGPLMLDLGVLYSPPDTRKVTDSQVQLTPADQYLAHDTIGNGIYTESVLILSIGVRGHFGI